MKKQLKFNWFTGGGFEKAGVKKNEFAEERKSFWRDFWKLYKSDKKDYLGNFRYKERKDDWL